MLIGQRPNLTTRHKVAQPIQREHDIGVLGALGGIEMSGNKSYLLRIGVGRNKAEAQIVIGERLHALDIRSRRTDEGNAAVFQVTAKRRVGNTAARSPTLPLDFLQLFEQY